MVWDNASISVTISGVGKILRYSAEVNTRVFAKADKVTRN